MRLASRRPPPSLGAALLACARGAAAALVCAVAGAACGEEVDAAASRLPAVARVAARKTLLEVGGVQVVNGGYGSALAVDPRSARHLYLLTDRGPNVDAARGGAKRLAAPDFVPHVGRFRLDGDRLELESTVELSSAAGRPLSGRPPAPLAGAAGEAAVDASGADLGADPDGVDSEGLVAMPDGTFWIADEYRPSLIHVDASGRTRERVEPGGAPRALPRVLARRRPNRGLEGLALAPGGKELLAIVQSALENPSAAAGAASRATRILSFDLATGRTRQWIYLRENAGNSCSELFALPSGAVLVLERDGRTPGDAARPSRDVRVWRADLSDATDVSDPGDDAAGRRIGGKTIEELDPDALAAAGVRVAKKTLVLDLLALGYPHDKAEGMALVGADTLAVSNDDDFGVTQDLGAPSGLAPKRLGGSPGVVDHGTVRFYRVGERAR